LDEVEYLVGRGHDRLAHKALEKGLHLAREIDLPAYKAELLRWKRRLVNKNPVKGQAELLHQIEQEEIVAIEQQLLDAKLRTLRAKAQTLFAEKVYARTAEVQAKLHAIRTDPILAADEAHFSFHARQTRQVIVAICDRMLGKNGPALDSLNLALQAWKGRNDLVRIYPDQYLNVLVDFLDLSLGARNFVAYLQESETLSQFDPVAPKLKARSLLLRINLDLRYSLLTGDFDRGLKAGMLAMAALETQAVDPSIEATVLYNLCSLYFLHGDHKRAIQIVNQILNRQHIPIRQDIADAARLIEMAIHLDLKHLDLVESLQRSMHRRLRLHPRSEDFENILVHGLKRWWEADPKHQEAILKETYQEIRELEGAAGLIGRQEVLLWLRSKIEGIKPAQIIKKEGAIA
jgi:hypothetical protein